MNLLLTSAGIKNASIHAALLNLLGKPIAECCALCITTASYAMRNGAEMAYKFLTGKPPRPCVSWVGRAWACWS